MELNNDQQQTPYPQNYPPHEDEINLIDYLQVVWRWKYLIIAGTLISALAAAVISLYMPKVYAVEMVLAPGVLEKAEGGKNIYVDSVPNIEAVIRHRGVEHQILNSIDASDNPPKSLLFKTSIPRGGNMIAVSYETSDIDQGLHILKDLQRLLLEKYSRRVEHLKEGHNLKIELKSNELTGLANQITMIRNDISVVEAEYKARAEQIQRSISVIKTQIEGRKNQIKNLEQKISDIVLETSRIEKNTDRLIKGRGELLSGLEGEDNTLSLTVYNSSIQQSIAHLNSLRGELTDTRYRLDREKVEIERAKIDILGLEAQKEDLKREIKHKIEGLKLEIKDVETKKDDTLYRLKISEFERNSVQNIQIIQPPISRPYPIGPNKTVNVMIASVLGLFVMLFSAFFLEYLGKQKSRRD